jgi:hypothetical protein
MGFYVRKSIKAGPFRYNLSKSGVGVSVGVPGFRVGTGPRGNYVRAGKGGVYYRATLGGSRRPSSPVGQRPTHTPPPVIGGNVPMQDVTGASARELVPTGAGDLVGQLNEAGSRLPLGWPTLLAVLVGAAAIGGIAAIVILLIGLPFCLWLNQRDRARRSVVAFYDVEDDHARWLTALVETFEALVQMNRAWRVNASGRVQNTYQYKVNSGANEIVKRVDAKRTLSGPKVLATNIAVPTIESGRQALHFLPDRLLVRDGKRFSDVSYGTLAAAYSAERFIESARKPHDSQQVDTTWRYVNVKGGPDRRFKNNRQLPVMLYGQVDLSAPNGLHWLIECSRAPLAEQLAQVLRSAPATPSSVEDSGTSGPGAGSQRDGLSADTEGHDRD